MDPMIEPLWNVSEFCVWMVSRNPEMVRVAAETRVGRMVRLLRDRARGINDPVVDARHLSGGNADFVV